MLLPKLLKTAAAPIISINYLPSEICSEEIRQMELIDKTIPGQTKTRPGN
jgi:hypothetical protein